MGWGGKRPGAGRNKDQTAIGKDLDWNKYKSKAKRRKMEVASKSTMNITKFFQKVTEEEDIKPIKNYNKNHVDEDISKESEVVDKDKFKESEVYSGIFYYNDK